MPASPYNVVEAYFVFPSQFKTFESIPLRRSYFMPVCYGHGIEEFGEGAVNTEGLNASQVGGAAPLGVSDDGGLAVGGDLASLAGAGAQVVISRDLQEDVLLVVLSLGLEVGDHKVARMDHLLLLFPPHAHTHTRATSR